MAVHKRAYRTYEGPLTPEKRRFLVVARYAMAEAVESRIFLCLLIAALVPTVVAAAILYVASSDAARALLQVPDVATRLVRSTEYFLGSLRAQGFIAFAITAWVAPTLISPDLVNGALPLYLSRPLTRGEYLLGKMVALLAFLSAITWVPMLLLFFLQASLAEGWLADNLRVGMALFVGSWVWILVLALVGLTISACIRWRVVASAALFGFFLMGAAFGEMWSNVLRNAWGRLVNPTYLMLVVWRQLFGTSPPPVVAGMPPPPPHMRLLTQDLPPAAAWLGLLALCLACLYLLHRRLRAREVVA